MKFSIKKKCKTLLIIFRWIFFFFGRWKFGSRTVAASTRRWWKRRSSRWAAVEAAAAPTGRCRTRRPRRRRRCRHPTLKVRPVPTAANTAATYLTWAWRHQDRDRLLERRSATCPRRHRRSPVRLRWRPAPGTSNLCRWAAIRRCRWDPALTCPNIPGTRQQPPQWIKDS